MKVAFATQDMKRVDAHFGWAGNIAIYDVAPDGHRFSHVVPFAAGAEDGNEDKLQERLAAIRDCAILYVAAIGGSAAARAVAQKVHPLKVAEPEPIEDLLAKLRAVLQGVPPPWLRKAMLKGCPREPALADDV